MGQKTSRRYPPGVRPGRRGGIEVRWRVNGVQKSRYIAEAPTPAALKRASKTRDELVAASRIVPEPTRAGSVLQFDSVVAEYLRKADLADTTRANYRSSLEKYWLPAFGSWPIKAIGHVEIKALLADLVEVSRARQRQILIALRQVFKFALYDREYIADDPTARVKVRRQQKQMPDPFTLDEREQVLAQLTGLPRLYFLLAFDTGMRCPSEILALQWRDFAGDTLHVCRTRVQRKLKGSTKTYRDRSVFLTDRAAYALVLHRRTAVGPWVFADSNGQPVLDAQQINRHWRDALEDAGVRYRRAYNCRHTFASLGLKAGANPAFLAEQLGHSLQIFYSTYAKWIKEAADAAEHDKIKTYLRDQ